MGLGPDYAKHRGASFFTAECHVRYLRELSAGNPVRTTIRLIDYDEKRIHFFAELYHAVEGWMSATSEQLALHVDMKSKKVAPFPDDVLDRLAAMKASHAALPAPDAIGRSIGMPKRS